MPDVAELAGVSVKTVSRVVNNEPHVSSVMTERVMRAVEELGFRRNDMARNLRAGTSSATIGLVIEDLSNPFYGTMARAVEVTAREHGAMVIWASSAGDGERERDHIIALLQRRVDGLLIVPSADDHRYLEPELAMGTPVVFLDRPPIGISTDLVTLDNRGGSRRGTESLLEAGHQRIAVLAPHASIPSVRERIDGFHDALEAASVDPIAELIRPDCIDPSGAEKAVNELLAMSSPPTAYFAANNRMTIGLVRALWRNGVDAPVVGFDDLELSEMLPLPVTLIVGDAGEMGHRAAQLLFENLDHRSNQPPRHIVIPTEFKTTGGPIPAPTHSTGQGGG